MDVLSDILDTLQLRGTLYFRTAFTSPWSIAVPAYGRSARFHLAVQGRCHVRIGSEHDVVLEPGDMIVIPNGAAQARADYFRLMNVNGAAHVLCETPDVQPAELEDVLQQAGYTGNGVLVYGGDATPNADTKLICGHLNFAETVDHPLLRALPPYLLVTAELRARATWLDELMRLITRQMFADAPGTKASVIRLTEALFIEVIRTCADQDDTLCGIIEAMSDHRIGRALSLMHHQLTEDWTLASIAREVGMSRSRFADAFQTMLGCTPMGYLSDLRLQKAMTLLADTMEPIQSVAAQVGYQSPAAFSRAFSNRYGQSPREVRRTAA